MMGNRYRAMVGVQTKATDSPTALTSDNSANDRRRRRDPFIAMNTDDYRASTARLRKYAPKRDLALRAGFIEATAAIIDENTMLSLDDAVAAMAVRMPIKTWRSVKDGLVAEGLLWRTEGGWMTELAAREIERRSKREAPEGRAITSRTSDDNPPKNSEYAAANNSKEFPPPTPPPTLTTCLSNSLTQAPRGSESGFAAGCQLQVSDVAIRLVSQQVGSSFAEKLLGEFTAWPKSKEATNPDKAFIGFVFKKTGRRVSDRALNAALIQASLEQHVEPEPTRG